MPFGLRAGLAGQPTCSAGVANEACAQWRRRRRHLATRLAGRLPSGWHGRRCCAASAALSLSLSLSLSLCVSAPDARARSGRAAISARARSQVTRDGYAILVVLIAPGRRAASLNWPHSLGLAREKGRGELPIRSWLAGWGRARRGRPISRRQAAGPHLARRVELEIPAARRLNKFARSGRNSIWPRVKCATRGRLSFVFARRLACSLLISFLAPAGGPREPSP